MEQAILIPREIREAGFPTARYLNEGEQARYDEAVRSFNSEKARETLRVPLNGSNLFKVLLLNKLGIRTATIQELEMIVDQNPGMLKGHYEDSPSVVLFSINTSYAPNKPLAKSLSKLVGKHEYPVLMTGLEPVEDHSTDYGLSLKPGDKFQFTEAPELAYANHGRKFLRLDERGMPIFDDKGTRTLHTRQDGLSRVYLGWGLGLVSYGEYLAGSDEDGRVVVVSAEGAANLKLQEHMLKLTAERDRQNDANEERFQRALAIMKNN
ncbi:hypothetical protein HYT23_02670 [Candidatus Pacearchaeota archaeon]|nr:hypothetical protein [Candidatus Pacearchaeota archaeon]